MLDGPCKDTEGCAFTNLAAWETKLGWYGQRLHHPQTAMTYTIHLFPASADPGNAGKAKITGM